MRQDCKLRIPFILASEIALFAGSGTLLVILPCVQMSAEHSLFILLSPTIYAQGLPLVFGPVAMLVATVRKSLYLQEVAVLYLCIVWLFL